MPFTFSYQVSPASFHIPAEETLINLFSQLLEKEERSFSHIGFVFCSDEFLHSINKKHLDHDYYTDVITFPYNVDPIDAEIYISSDRVLENAATHRVEFRTEFLRVMIHGLLHLCGYSDKSDQLRSAMRSAEDRYLKEFGFL